MAIRFSASELRGAFVPNRKLSAVSVQILIATQVAIAFAIWWQSPFVVLPRPEEVFRALGELWMKEGLGQELIASLTLNLEALLWTVLLSLGLSYLTVLPAIRPLALALSKGRFLGLIGLTFIFTLITGGGHALKLALLVFGMTVFFLTSMVAEVEELPREKFDHARTLRMSEWRVVWEVVVLGTADKALELLRQNAAIGWMMLTMVEGISRSDGGIGAMLLNQNKHFRLAEVFAIQFVILGVGLAQDYAIGALTRAVLPYASMTKERR